MHKIKVTPTARNDLREISKYIAQNDPAAASRTKNKLIASLKRLEMFPLSSPLVPDAELAGRGYRVLRCGNYLCFYRMKNGVVFVYRIIHCAGEY